MNRTLRMSFKTVDDDTWTLNLRHAKSGITAQEAQTAMTAIIDHPVFLAGASSAIGAEIVEQTITELV